MTSLAPCYRGSVNAWECDENGHLNVRFHLAKANQGLPFVLESAGLPGARPRVRAQHLRFLEEARAAVPLTILAGIAASDVVYSEVRHSLTGKVLATVLTEVGAAFPHHAPRCTVPEYGAPRGIRPGSLPPPDYASIPELGFVEIGRGAIAASECDERGELEPFQYVGRMADSVYNLFAQFQSEEELLRRSSGVEGGALVELRLEIHAPLRAGSLFTIRSGVAAIGRKTQHFVHLFCDERSRECVATAQGVAVPMDLRTRKSIELPEARRRRIEAKLLRLPR